jgi:hypothetical protein
MLDVWKRIEDIDISKHIIWNDIKELIIECDIDNGELIDLPPNLSKLLCNNANIRKFHYLPDNLTHLNCQNNELSEFPDLPHTLTTLICGGNLFKKLPQLSNTIQYLNISWNFNFGEKYLFELSELPKNLIRLDCAANKLSEIPKLPENLLYLICNSNNLCKLPELPKKLSYLDCENNKLPELPELPDSLTHLYCSRNCLTNLPKLPNNLQELLFTHNKILTIPKISELPNNLIKFDGSDNICHTFETLFHDTNEQNINIQDNRSLMSHFFEICFLIILVCIIIYFF